jgi:hypothetical protein
MIRRLRLVAPTLLFCLLACMVAASVRAPSSEAAFEITELGTETSILGAPSRQAGAHPDFHIQVRVPMTEVNGLKTPDGSLRDIKVTLPAGMVGNPTAVGTCAPGQLVGGAGGAFPVCPVASQIGTAKMILSSAFTSSGEDFVETQLYNMETTEGPAVFGLNFLGAVALIRGQVDPRDYRVSTITAHISQGLPLLGVDLTIWGVPGDPSHDAKRVNTREEAFSVPTPSPSPRVPFMTSPTSCPVGPVATEVEADSWENPGAFSVASVSSDMNGIPFQIEGCERLGFDPKVTIAATSHRALSPTGVDVHIEVPQSEAPDGLATAQVKKTVVTLPQGFAISSSAAAGQAACSQAEIGIGTNDPPTCPASSKLGAVRIKTPLLKEELEGGVYLAQQKSNPFGSDYAMYIAAKGPGFYLKLSGKIEADPVTGQVTTIFDNQPQLPYEDLTLTLRGGSNAPLVAPACGSYMAKVQMTSWASSEPVELESPLSVNEGCSDGTFSPGLKAGTKNPVGGSFSPFVLQVTRQDGEQNLSKIQATLPPGLLAKLSGVPLCSDAQAATGDCPSGSQVGRTVVGVGAGSNPIYVPEAGKSPTAVYLAGPYKDAPYSLVVKVPAQAGPFDLGTVVVRNALKVDPFTTQVTAESDPLPQILEGIPISYRDVRVEVDRPDFTVNPTNCSQFAVTSSLTSATGQTASPKAPFAAANCERLAFKPHLKLQLKGSTKRTGQPALKAVLTYPQKGAYANIARAQVSLPGSEFLEQTNLNKTCTRPVLLEGNCPKSAVYGRAKAWSPLLEKPLEGPVYLVGGFGYQLPALVADLGGQIRVILKGKIDSGRDHGLRTTFETVPDARVSRFVLQMKGGKKYGLLINSEDICEKPQKLKAAFTAQNGKTDTFEQKIATGCGGKKPKKKGGS